MEVGKPTYVYKPLACIQVRQGDVERGKCPVGKYFNPDSYHIPGIVRSAAEYNMEVSSTIVPQTMRDVPSRNGLDNDGFGYQRPFIKPTMSIPMATPSITTRKVPSILPRISPGSGMRHI